MALAVEKGDKICFDGKLGGGGNKRGFQTDKRFVEWLAGLKEYSKEGTSNSQHQGKGFHTGLRPFSWPGWAGWDRKSESPDRM